MGIIFGAVIDKNGSYHSPCGDRPSLLPREHGFSRSRGHAYVLSLLHQITPRGSSNKLFFRRLFY
jgi:hypothetical protein